MDKYINIKVWMDTRRKLRMIAALTHETLIRVVDRLAEAELGKLAEREGGSDGDDAGGPVDAEPGA